jgi:hypothetical protein
VTVTAGGFKAGTSAQIIFHSDPVVLANVTANGNGVVSASVTIPSGASAGSHTLEVRGTAADGSVRSLSAPFTVIALLARTGDSLAPLFVFAVVLMLAGAFGKRIGRPLPLKHGIRR